MFRQLLMLCVVIWWPTILSAETIKVRSGEHATFSRLVIYLDPSDTPALIRTPTGLRITSGNATDRFDIAGIFDLIPRDRIADVTAPKGGTLDITLNCPCDAVTQTLSNGRFVIDIVDTPPPEAPPAPARREQPDKPQDTARLARRGLPIAGFADADDGIGAVDPPEEKDAENTPSPMTAQPLTEKTLLEQLARAASQGLVNAPSILETEEDPTPATPPSPSPEPSAQPPEPPQNHVRIQTSVDRDTDRSTGATGVSDLGPACLPAAAFAVANWGKDQGDTLDFATYRTTLLTEADALDPDTFRHFIQHQIYLTLGAEAQAHLKKYDGVLEDGADLLLMAEIMENGTATGHARMTTQLACDGPVVLWAVLSHPRLPRDRPINTAAMIYEFSALPRHLRSHLGPMLMRKFLAIGDTDTSIEINHISQRGIETTDTANALSRAQLSLKTGNSTEARNQLRDIAETDDRNAVEAILLLVDSHIETRTGIPDRTLARLGALAHEHRGSAKGDELAMAELRALIHAARFGEVREKLHELPRFPDRAEDRHIHILNAFGRALTGAGADGAFLRNIVGQPMWADADEETRIAIAGRLLDLGFASAAKDLLINQPAPPGRAARLLIAKAALAEDQAKVALGYLAGLSDDEAQELRNTAMRATNPPVAPEASPDDQPQDTSGQVAAEISLEAYETLIEDSQAERARVDLALQSAPGL